MGEFAWCRFEPNEGEFHFEWLDTVVETLGKAGVKTVMCTPTACPPAWMCEKYPEILYVDNRGVRRGFGGRRHYCYTNERYREFSRQDRRRRSGSITARIPILWDSRLTTNRRRKLLAGATAEVCQKAFKQWIRDRYHTVEEWNRRSGSVCLVSGADGFFTGVRTGDDH